MQFLFIAANANAQLRVDSIGQVSVKRSINLPNIINGGIIKVGYSVTNQEDYGNVNFNSGKITIKGHEVELHSGTAIESGAEFNVETR